MLIYSIDTHFESIASVVSILLQYVINGIVSPIASIN